MLFTNSRQCCIPWGTQCASFSRFLAQTSISSSRKSQTSFTAGVPNFSGTRDKFGGRQFFHQPGWGGDDLRNHSSALHFRLPRKRHFISILWHQLLLRSSGIRFWRLRTSALLDHREQSSLRYAWLTFHILLISRWESFPSGYFSEIIWKHSLFPSPSLGQNFPSICGEHSCRRDRRCAWLFLSYLWDFFQFGPQRVLQESRDVPFSFFKLHLLNIHQVMDSTSTISQGNKNSLQPALPQTELPTIGRCWLFLPGDVKTSGSDFPRQSSVLRTDACQSSPR